MAEHVACPLCFCTDTTPYFENKHRPYLLCSACRLVFVPPRFHLSSSAEKAEYDLHHNDPADSGYRKFLSRLTDPLQERIAAGSSGLDFGCGPGPALAEMLTEAGHKVALYDPYYQPDTSVLEQDYDFICATEVVEHLRTPADEFRQLFSLLRPGGILAIMTKLVRNQQAFAGWHYIRDLTHICFYSRDSFRWLAQHYAAEVEFIGADVILLRNPLPPQKV
ncbi:Methyltransferase domain-containing protein [Malonomonas rubra DSM 5091]|uniref:Methyltransferase domain-containing protein n=1 Tax=Malonomonas rubra DSM 5091 TaxID=1122189 RepID=A0A1M6JF49_MALRU|nr:class I SAM-dependent methyltransferase [Malonomonas rubra]SHJ45339.1 Methyltransferase domain-containing protein [Malonomonas rubra DSM 5091]